MNINDTNLLIFYLVGGVLAIALTLIAIFGIRKK